MQIIYPKDLSSKKIEHKKKKAETEEIMKEKKFLA